MTSEKITRGNLAVARFDKGVDSLAARASKLTERACIRGMERLINTLLDELLQAGIAVDGEWLFGLYDPAKTRVLRASRGERRAAG